MIMQVGTKFLS